MEFSKAILTFSGICDGLGSRLCHLIPLRTVATALCIRPNPLLALQKRSLSQSAMKRKNIVGSSGS
jgi:hypothetical protein